MVGFTFVYGVDGFGADTAPAYEEGFFLNYKKAYVHFKKLTERCLAENDTRFFEKGWGEDYYPNTYEEVMTALEKECDKTGDWDKYQAEVDKHTLTNIDDICHNIMEYEEPPYHFYQMVEVEIVD